MSSYGSDSCTECGIVSELLLAPRFPHICSRCLFPPPGTPDAHALPETALVDDLSSIERLKMQKGIGVFMRGGHRGR